MSVHGPILRRLLLAPRREVIVDDRRRYRGFEILLGALHVAERLSEISRSRTVGLLLPTSGAFPIAALGAWIAGKVIVPLNYLLGHDELRYVIADCECDTVIAVQPMLDFVLGTQDSLGSGSDGSQHASDRAWSAISSARLLRLEDIPFKSIPEPRWPASARDEDLAVLLYTSGTSGKPKGVMLTHGNITANIAQVCERVKFDHRDKLLGVLPQFHSFGMTVLTLLPLTAGCRVVYTARFVPNRLVKLIREHRPTAMVAIPSMYNAILHVKDAAPADFTSLRYVVSGGEPLPAAVPEGFLKRFNVLINEGYGLTETSPVTNVCVPWEYRPRSVGRALEAIEQLIVNADTDEVLPPGRDGEVRMRGPNVMEGYYKLPRETAATFDRRGFFRTGDIGRMDEDGHLYITGRLKDMIIIAGENVFPREIEEVLNRHPSVKESGVVGVADPMRGEVPMAFVELKEGGGGDAGLAVAAPPCDRFDEKELLAWCREHLAGYKVPREVRCLPQLPRGPTGKVLRRELRRLA